VALILGALSWAVKKGFVRTNPLAGRIERPQPILRGRDARMSEELMDLLIAECFTRATYHRKVRTDKPAVHLRNVGFSESFGRYLWLLRVTGARPIEIRSAEAHNYVGGRLVYRWNTQKGYVWKNAKKSQRDRLIFLTPEAQAYVEQCVKKYPEGPIFRTLRGDPWMPTNITNKWRRWLLRRPNVAAHLEEHGIDPKQMRTYNFRHSAISSFLDGGGDIYVAAQLFGTGVKMIEKRYGHPDVERLQEQFMAFAARVPLPTTAQAASSAGRVADAAAGQLRLARRRGRRLQQLGQARLLDEDLAEAAVDAQRAAGDELVEQLGRHRPVEAGHALLDGQVGFHR
jgi:hypothetical protein